MNLKANILFIVLCIFFCSALFAKINRQNLVERHNVTIYQNNPKKPMQVGNGEFAYNVDITGMQTFNPHNTMSHWAWHSMPLQNGLNPNDFKGKTILINGSPVVCEIDNPDQPELSQWLAANPHPINLGRIGLSLTYKDGALATLDDIKKSQQRLNLWTGIITSTFVFDNEMVEVKTACHPKLDEIGIEIKSDLIAKGQLKIALEFPYADDRFGSDFVGDFTSPNKHCSSLKFVGNNLLVERKIDDLSYFVNIQSNKKLNYEQTEATTNPHKLLVIPTSSHSSFTFHFSKTTVSPKPTIDKVFVASTSGWKKYWLSGAAIDFSKCTDKRAIELERRVVLSQYLMRVNNAGSLPPPESGLMKNNWYGKFHFEMIWWHGVHFALWNRWNELDNMLKVYQKFLPTSMERARKQGYKGARWPKSTGNIDREWPFVMHAFLIWQQPHPIYFAELDYRLHPSQKTLDKWKEIVFASADFLASYSALDSVTGQYNLNPPLIAASENTTSEETKNPAFELGYWRYGLRTAITWRKRLNLPESQVWNNVYKNLAPLPIQENKYVTFEGVKNMWDKYNYEHPMLIATYGMLPGDGVDTAILRNTFLDVIKTWDYSRTWGWDYPVFAMTAARLNLPEKAIDMLLFNNEHCSFDNLGYNSWVYLPGNGGLLTTIAMMAGGWDGDNGVYAPGFPKNGKWNVVVEGFNKMQ